MKNKTSFWSKTNSLLSTKISLFIVWLLIFFLNLAILQYFRHGGKFPAIQHRTLTSGFVAKWGKHFFYFFYYTGYFPLATTDQNLTYSRQGAWNEIKKHGHSLIMEYYHWMRYGENARIFAFLPDAIVKGSAKNPSLSLFNFLNFVLALMALFWGFWKIRRPLTGIFLILLINFTPFFIYEVYHNQNIFGLLGSEFFLVMGLTLPLLFNRTKNTLAWLILGLLLAIFIGFNSQIRNETAIVILSLLLIYWLTSNLKISHKLIATALIIFGFFATRQLITKYFDWNFKRTAQLVKKYGGDVYTGYRTNGHPFWHPFFCGLGDFGQKYGYQWRDSVAYNYALPILEKKYHMKINYPGHGLHLLQYYDKQHNYYVKPEELPHYQQILKQKVLHDITRHPFWYLSILFKRLLRILTKTIPVPLAGWLIFPALYWAIKFKFWNWLKLIIISLPLSATPLLIFSGGGATYNSVFPYIVLAFLLELELCKNKIYLKQCGTVSQ